MASPEPSTKPTILIAAFSGRALAQSAQRAGFTPLVVDCFGDLDARNAAHQLTCLPARVQVGFLKRPLIAALERLVAAAPSPPVGLVLGGGFECNPRLVAALADRFPLIGNSADTIRRVKDPAEFFGTLAHLGIRHPETRLTPPDDPAGWLMKRIGGSGGLHIHFCPPSFEPDPRRYFQREEKGDAISVLAVASRRGTAVALSRQWSSPRKRRPYRYGGASTGMPVEAELEARLVDTALAVIEAFDLVGLISLDFVLHDGEALLLEINPRPGATLDILDDANGRLFAAHVAAARGENPAALLKGRWQPPRAAAAAYLYADQGPLTVPAMTWPEWSADRPAAGTEIARGQPLATVTATASTGREAENLCRERLSALAQLVYEGSKKEGIVRL
jgi:predicted ATP-grasp superfamily ATP-dependent carboligase